MPELYMKDIKVLTFREEEGVATEITKVNTPELLPLCLSKECSAESFNTFLVKRGMPKDREGWQEIKMEYDSVLGNGWDVCRSRASLSDQYWVKYRTEEWKDVNFFTRPYSSDIGNLVFSPWDFVKKKIDCNSPDLTTNGVLKKRWKQRKDLSSYLVKAGSVITHQEPLSEVLVSVLLEQLKIIPFVRYDFCVEGITMCSQCDNFITSDTELVPASYIYHLQERQPNVSVYSHLLKMCDAFEIEGAKDFIDGMIFIDTITGNEDRNLGNIAFIRDVNTRKLKCGPLFDFGAAYWSSSKINNAVKSRFFGDVEKRVFQRMKKHCDISTILKNDGYSKCIERYPCINYLKKQELISSIKQRNRNLFKEKELEL